jgi:guanylate kinase
MNKKRIILVGKAASGKDYARKILEKKSYTYGISYTTRPPRADEKEGLDYFFVSVEKFQDMEALDLWYEYVVFNGWYYGTTKSQFYENCNVFIMTPKGLSHLTENDRNESLVIYFEIKEDIRRERMNLRQGNADSVERRIEADNVDFTDFNDYDVLINQEQYTEEYLMNIINDNLIHIAHV